MPRAASAARAVDIGMRHGSARIRLEGERLRHPAGAEIAGERGIVARARAGEAVEQAVRAFEHGARADKAGAPEQRGAQARLRRPARMQPLGPGAFGEIFDDAAGHRARDAQCIHHLPTSELERRADARRCRDGPEHRGRMEAGLVHRLWHHEAQPANRLDPDRDAEERRSPVALVPLAGRKHRRHDDGAGMHGTALERVVEILAMRRRAIDESGSGRARAPRVPDRGAVAVVIPAGERGLDILFVAGGEAEPHHVDEQVLAFAPHRRRQRSGLDRRDPVRQILRNGDLGKAGVHSIRRCAGARPRSRGCD